MNATIPRLAAPVLAALVATACAGAPLSPAEMASSRTSKTASLWSDGFAGVLRYNPARCDCPEFEIQLGGVWHRVEITNDLKEDPLMIDLYREALSGGPGWTIRITGTTRGVQKQRFRSPIIRLEVDSLCGNGGCPVPGDDGNAPADNAGPRP